MRRSGKFELKIATRCGEEIPRSDDTGVCRIQKCCTASEGLVRWANLRADV